MDSLKIEGGAVSVKVVGDIVVEIDLVSDFKAPTTIYIPNVIEGHKITTIGDGINSIHPGSRYAQKLCGVSFVIDDKISFIEKNAFSGMVINELHWPACCKKIPSYCFFQTEIKSITGIENVLSIDYQAFRRTRGMKEFVIPDVCEELGYSAFGESDFEMIIGGKSVRVIPSNCFAACRKLRKISNLNAVTEVSSFAFENCESLEEFSFPDELMKIGYRSFANTELKSVDLSGTIVESIERGAFENCKSLHQYTPSIFCTTDIMDPMHCRTR